MFRGKLPSDVAKRPAERVFEVVEVRRQTYGCLKSSSIGSGEGDGEENDSCYLVHDLSNEDKKMCRRRTSLLRWSK